MGSRGTCLVALAALCLGSGPPGVPSPEPPSRGFLPPLQEFTSPADAAGRQRRLVLLESAGGDEVLVDETIESGRVTRRRRMAANRIIVKSRGGAEAMRDFPSRRRLWGWPDVYLVTLPRDEVARDVKAGLSPVERASAACAGRPDVEFAEPDLYLELSQAPDDPGFAGQPGLQIIAAPHAWDTTTGSASLKAAVIDSGVAYDHPDLAANIWTNPGEIPGNGLDDDGNGLIDDVHGWDFGLGASDPYDTIGHGTHLAGTIGAAGNNGVGVTGVCWTVRILCLKATDATGSVPVSAAAQAVLYAASMGCRVAANGYGTTTFPQVLHDAVAQADAAGMLCVAAAGNNGTDNDLFPVYPASFNLPNVISVTATDAQDGLAAFANFGAATVHVGAPGVAILSTEPVGYGSRSGTSSAVGFVSGACALLAGAHPGLTHLQIRALILGGAAAAPALEGRTASGGRLSFLTIMDLEPKGDGPCGAAGSRGSAGTLGLAALCALAGMAAGRRRP